MVREAAKRAEKMAAADKRLNKFDPRTAVYQQQYQGRFDPPSEGFTTHRHYGKGMVHTAKDNFFHHIMAQNAMYRRKYLEPADERIRWAENLDKMNPTTRSLLSVDEEARHLLDKMYAGMKIPREFMQPSMSLKQTGPNDFIANVSAPVDYIKVTVTVPNSEVEA